MQKKIGAILLVAGTCIGSGMIALPLVLAKLGLIPSLLLMVIIWYFMYYTSLINLELNLQAGQGLALGALGRRFSGRVAETVGNVSLKLLSYSLLAVFIYGGSSVIQELMASKMGSDYSFNSIASLYALVAIGMLLLPIRLIDYFNRFLFIGLLCVVALLIAGLAITLDWSDLPLFSHQYNEISVWAAVIPVVFTSFGFQVIFHTLTNYCNGDVKKLKKAFLYGTLIPAVVYILWTAVILSVVYHENPNFYSQMEAGTAEIGGLIKVLGGIAKGQSVQLIVWCITTLAIATSVIGVGVGLFDSMKRTMPKIPAAILTILPAYLLVIYIPNAFIAVLGFAGLILTVIAILLPAYLFGKIATDRLFYLELRKTGLIRLSLGVALLVIISEIYNML